MKKLFAIFALAAATLLSGCGRIETGQVGLRTDFNGTLSNKVEGEGFYTSVVGHVDPYTLKEVGIQLDNLTPKAKDQLSLKELDVTVYYRVNEAFIRPLAVKRTKQSSDIGGGVYAPQYVFVESISRSEIADVVSKHESATIHTQRTILEDDSKKAIQSNLDSSDPGAFVVTRVVVRQVLTDPTIEASIRNVVAKGKEKEAADLQVGIANSLALANAKTALTLTPAFLQHQRNLVLMKFAENGKATLILDGTESGKILNVHQ